MVDLKEFKRPLLAIFLIIGVLMVMLMIGFTIGILSDNPDGLEATLINARGEDWLEGLDSPWDPILGWIDNDYLSGTIGILLSFCLIIAIFYAAIAFSKRRNTEK